MNQYSFDDLELDLPDITEMLEGPELNTDFIVDIDDFTSQIAGLKEDIRKRASWHKGNRYHYPLCDLSDRLALHKRKFGMIASSFRTGNKGMALIDIKQPDNVRFFAMKAIEIICGLFRLNKKEGWCIITTPRRRHHHNHFATMVCQQISEMIGIPFYEDVVEATTRGRINVRFELMKPIQEPNIIIYDDIVTTGSTLQETVRPFADKNIFIVVGIFNH